jgi:hypothetical protein
VRSYRAGIPVRSTFKSIAGVVDGRQEPNRTVVHKVVGQSRLVLNVTASHLISHRTLIGKQSPWQLLELVTIPLAWRYHPVTVFIGARISAIQSKD